MRGECMSAADHLAGGLRPMKNSTAEQRLSTANQNVPSDRREWVKPEVKSAEVAVATLTGSAVPPITDFVTCAS